MVAVQLIQNIQKLKNMKTLKGLLILLAAPLLFLSFEVTESNDWEVPAKYKTMKNPVTANSSSIAEGKALYVKHCKSCHGKEGYGDGPKAEELDGDLGDFSSAAFQKQSDGELYYKTTTGRDDMPGFSKKIPDSEERWSVVNYMRTLKE